MGRFFDYPNKTVLDSTDEILLSRDGTEEFNCTVQTVVTHVETELNIADLATLTDATALAEAAETAANGYTDSEMAAHLDATTGWDHSQFLTNSTIPAIAISETFVVDTYAEMLALPDGTAFGQVQVGDVAVVNDTTAETYDSYIYDGATWIALTQFVGALGQLSDVEVAGVQVGDSLGYDGTNWVPAIGGLSAILSIDSRAADATIGEYPVGYSAMESVTGLFADSTEVGSVNTVNVDSTHGYQQYTIEDSNKNEFYNRAWVITDETAGIDPNDEFPSFDGVRWHTNDSEVSGGNLIFTQAGFNAGDNLSSRFQYDTAFDFKISARFSSIWRAQILGPSTTMFEFGLQVGVDVGGQYSDAALQLEFEDTDVPTSDRVSVRFATNTAEDTGITLQQSSGAGSNLDGTAVLIWDSTTQTLSGYYLIGVTQYGFNSQQYLSMPALVNLWVGEGGGRSHAQMWMDFYHTEYGVTVPATIPASEGWNSWSKYIDETSVIDLITTTVHSHDQLSDLDTTGSPSFVEVTALGTQGFGVRGTLTSVDPTGYLRAVNGQAVISSLSSNNGQYVTGGQFEATLIYDTYDYTAAAVGVSGNFISQNSSGQTAEGIGGRFEAAKGIGDGGVTTLKGLETSVRNATATATVDNGYAIFIKQATVTGAITNLYGMYQEGSERNVLQGYLGLGGNTDPQYPLDATGDINITGDYYLDGTAVPVLPFDATDGQIAVKQSGDWVAGTLTVYQTVIPVQDTPPAGASEGDLWIDTST